MRDVQIDAELETLIPPLNAEEERALESLIRERGCQQPLVAWKSTSGPILIDGHHRYAICKRNDVSFKVQELEFSSREDVVAWMIRNQLGRRNMTTYHKAILALSLHKRLPKKPLEDIADLCGLSRSTLHRVNVVVREGDEELNALLRTGAISIRAAHARLYPEAPADLPPPAPPVPAPRPLSPTKPAAEVTKESLVPRGKTMVNGELADDPDDIYEMRRAGRFPADYVPSLNVAEPDPEADLEIDEPTEEEWLASLYARSRLSEVCRDRFDRTAKLFRIMEQPILAARGEMRAAIKAVGLQQSHLPRWAFWLWSPLNSQPPESWVPCPESEKGGCNGTGQIVFGECPKCKGDGFLTGRFNA